MNFFDLFKQTERNKKIIPAIFVVDSSGNMAGERIHGVNNLIKTMTELFADYNMKENRKYDLKLAVLEFASDSQWVTNGLEDPVGLHIPVISCGGVANLGSALSELENKFSRREFFNEFNTYTSPIVCFIAGGTPADHCITALKKLRDNKWYKTAKKVAVGIGNNVDCSILGQVIGDSDAVIHLNSVVFLKEILIGLFFSFIASPTDIAEACLSVKPAVVDVRNEFDSDSLCFSRREMDEFDADEFCETCALSNHSENSFDSNDTANTLSSWGDSDWDIIEPVHLDSMMKQNDTCSSIKKECEFIPPCRPAMIPEMPSKVNVGQVEFSAVIPKRIIKGEYAIINILVYEELYRNIVDRVIANSDEEVREIIASAQEISDNTEIRIVLSSPDMNLVDCDETQKWKGRYLTFNFPVEISNDYAKKQILFIATVYFNNLIATKLKFVVNCTSVSEQKIQVTREDIATAFISYASQDRSRVATIIQGMKKARPDMDIFFDVESLRSGADWEKTLKIEIVQRDILFLCWSDFAKNSEWVEKEWRYALENKGLDFIEPIPLASPAKCPPPEELKSKYFYDRALLYLEL